MKAGRAPNGFGARSRDWKKAYRDSKAQDPKHKPGDTWKAVRAQLKDDAEELGRRYKGKCGYCEARMAHVSNGQIEHYRPKKKFPARMFDWQNWVYSCGRCNQKKWAHFPMNAGQPVLLHPGRPADDPTKHIEFVGVEPVQLTDRGKETIRLIGLKRAPLRAERVEWLAIIQILLLTCVQVDGQAKSDIREFLIWSMQDDAPYTAMVRAFIGEKAPKLANPPQPHERVAFDDWAQRVEALVESYASDGVVDLE